MTVSQMSDSIDQKIIEVMDQVKEDLGLSINDITSLTGGKNYMRVCEFHQRVFHESYLFTIERQADVLGLNPDTVSSRIYKVL